MAGVVAEEPAGLGSGGRSPLKAAVTETARSMASVFKNPRLRRIQLALAGSMIGDWAYSTAVSVWAYHVGGAAAVGIWQAVRLGLMAVTAPLGATLADRFSRKAVMIGADLVRAVLVCAAAACLFLHASAWPVFLLATLTALLGTPFRAAQRAMMPSLANHPDELTASNGTSSTIESLAFFLGPAIGAVLIAVASVPVVFLVDAATFVWSMFLVAGVRAIRTAPAEPGPAAVSNAVSVTGAEGTEDADGPSAAEPAGAGFLHETAAGFRSIWADKDLLVVVGEICAQTVVAGASAVFMIVMAVEILMSGPKGVGYLNSALGVGAIVGGLYAISRASRHKLGQDLTAGVVLWALPLLLVTVAPVPVAAYVAMVLLGVANPLVDVNMDTIIQRVTPDEVMGRVFGALEACLIGTMALGALVMPLLIHLVGLRTSLAIVGAVITLLALAGLPRMRRLDLRLSAPAGLPLLTTIPMFAPLAPAVVESLARALVRVEVPAGRVFLREGDESDRFYVIETGMVEVTAADGRVLRREGPGDFFGEIGLLRDVPRTATITAVADTTLQALGREEFLEAVTGQAESKLAADDVATRRLLTV
jgi:MFS family permease